MSTQNNIRFAGAQIPCTNNLDNNILHIKTAIDWAAENSVDYLLTPEGSLSGYFPGFDVFEGRTINDLYNAEKTVVEYAILKGVGLCLGTMWGESDSTFHEGYRKENQIRFYDSTGLFLGKTNKTYILPSYDQTAPNTEAEAISMTHRVQDFFAAGLICNDFWGGPMTNCISLPLYVRDQLNVHVIFHATNGMRGILPVYDEITDAWHEGNHRMISFATGVPIITVDNSIKMDGTEYDGRTSSTSGILLNGEWKVKAPRTGTHYFYYDFDCLDLANNQLGKHPDHDIMANLNIQGA